MTRHQSVKLQCVFSGARNIAQKRREVEAPLPPSWRHLQCAPGPLNIEQHLHVWNSKQNCINHSALLLLCCARRLTTWHCMNVSICMALAVLVNGFNYSKTVITYSQVPHSIRTCRLAAHTLAASSSSASGSERVYFNSLLYFLCVCWFGLRMRLRGQTKFAAIRKIQIYVTIVLFPRISLFTFFSVLFPYFKIPLPCAAGNISGNLYQKISVFEETDLWDNKSTCTLRLTKRNG